MSNPVDFGDLSLKGLKEAIEGMRNLAPEAAPAGHGDKAPPSFSKAQPEPDTHSR
jgi:hypothetical protein